LAGQKDDLRLELQELTSNARETNSSVEPRNSKQQQRESLSSPIDEVLNNTAGSPSHPPLGDEDHEEIKYKENYENERRRVKKLKSKQQTYCTTMCCIIKMCLTVFILLHLIL